MKEGNFWDLEGVSDALLQQGLTALLTAGARTEARIVAHLAEVDARKLHLSMGSNSLFDYCLKRLGLSNNEAFHRITAARLARRFPIIFQLLESRDVHLTAVCLLRDHLTPENHVELLTEVSHKTKSQIEELLARRFPQADVPNRLRKLPAFEARSKGTYLLQLNVSTELKQKLEHARDLMSHANPSGDLAVLVERAVDVLLERLEARRFAQTKCKPRGGERPVGGEPRAVPRGGDSGARRQSDRGIVGRRHHLCHDVRRTVVARDGQQCTFVGEDGQRCEARAFLQFHHERPWATGGADTVENLRVMCRAHNQLLAERELGADHVAHAIERRRTRA